MSEWRSWTDNPPQIGWAPILIRKIGGAMCWMSLAGARDESWPKFLEWLPLGIYREEFYQTTGQWI